MFKLIKRYSINNFCLVSFILLSSLFISENVFSRDYWNRKFTTVTYDPADNSISIRFVVYDYYFNSINREQAGAYLSSCDFYFSSNNRRYILLMRAETKSQKESFFTELTMRFKHTGTNLQFLGCYKPSDALDWSDNKDVTVEVKNTKLIRNAESIAFFTVKWFLGYKFRYVKRIRLKGQWNVNDLPPYIIEDVDYDIPSRDLLKSTVNQSENNRVKVAAKSDAIVISGAENGENIKVFNVAGVGANRIRPIGGNDERN